MKLFETWLDEFVSDSEIKNYGNNSFRRDRPGHSRQSRGGEVLIFLRGYLPGVVREDLNIQGHAIKRAIKLANLLDKLMNRISAITSLLNDFLGSQNTKLHVSSISIGSNLLGATALITHVTKELSF